MSDLRDLPVVNDLNLGIDEPEPTETIVSPQASKQLPIEGLERALVSKVVSLGVLTPILWAYTSAGDASDFRSPVCRQVWPWLLKHHADHHHVPDRDQLRVRFPTFRFVVVPDALLSLADRVFSQARTVSRG